MTTYKNLKCQHFPMGWLYTVTGFGHGTWICCFSFFENLVTSVVGALPTKFDKVSQLYCHTMRRLKALQNLLLQFFQHKYPVLSFSYHHQKKQDTFVMAFLDCTYHLNTFLIRLKFKPMLLSQIST